MNNNIVLDFTQNKSMESLLAGQPVAIMPAELAKKLLRMYAEKLQRVKFEGLKLEHCEDLSRSLNMDELIAKQVSFVVEQELIQNITHEQWDAYAVPEIVTAL